MRTEHRPQAVDTGLSLWVIHQPLPGPVGAVWMQHLPSGGCPGSEEVTRSTEGMVALRGDMAREDQPSHGEELT